jgi:hypothetical protein
MRFVLICGVFTGATLACAGDGERRPAPGDGDAAPTAALTSPASAPAAEADSSWIVVTKPTIIAFHPLATNAQLEADEGLATALDDLAFHLGSAMDSLVARGFAVRYQPGDTVKLRSAAAPFAFVRQRDSADVGYVFADSLGRRAVVYGVRTHLDLIAYADAFRKTGTLPPTP